MAAAEGFYRFEAKVVSRGGGKSAVAASAYQSGSVVAAAAYRAGERLQNEDTGRVHNFANKRGVLGAEIMLPEHAPHWMRSRQALWNEVERVETRINSQLARDFIISIPHQFSPEQRRDVIRDFAQQAFVSRGIPVDIAWHSPDRADKLNHHAHLLTPFRTVSGLGFSQQKLRVPRSQHRDELQGLRVLWADVANVHLERAGLAVRVDHRSLAERGIDRTPQPKLGRLAKHVIEKEGRQSLAGTDRAMVIDLNARMAAAKIEHARAVTERAEIVSLIVERTKRGQAMDPKQVDRLIDEHHNGQNERQQAGYAQLRHEQQRTEAQKKDQLRRELETEAERKAEKGGASPDRANDGGLNSAEARYQIALGEHYNPRDPFGSMAKAAGAEHAAFMRQQEDLKQQAFAEKDPLKKKILENRRMLESADYMAITSDRLAGISEAVAGRRDAPQAEKDRASAAFWRENGDNLRQGRDALLKQVQERDQAREQQGRAAAGRATAGGARAASQDAPARDDAQQPRPKAEERQPQPQPPPQQGRGDVPPAWAAYLAAEKPATARQGDSERQPPAGKERSDRQQARGGWNSGKEMTDAERGRIAQQHDRENGDHNQAMDRAARERDGRHGGGRRR